MQRFRVGALATAGVLVLALTLGGCSSNDTQSLFANATNPPVASSGGGQSGSTAPLAAQPGTQGSGQAGAQAVAQQATAVPQQAQAQMDAEEQLVANVFDRVSPAVVRISTGQGLGSGFLVDTDGHLITNNHVVAGSNNGQVQVSFTGLFETIGQVVGADPDSDVAVVKVDELPQGIVPIELGDSNQVRVGQRTIAIGNPLGQDRTVTTGIVSAIGRTISEDNSGYSIGGAIQTDAAINPGNSGGPLLDSHGRVIGMNTAILSESGASSGIGFAVPVNLIKKVAPALISQGRYDHPWLGVGLADVTTLDARQQSLPSAGVLIQPSGQGSPAVQAGLRGQAILTAINGTPVTSRDELISYLEVNTKPGDTVTLTLVTGQGQQQDLQVQLGARPHVEDRQQP